MSSIRKPQVLSKNSNVSLDRAKDFKGTIKNLLVYMQKDVISLIISLIIVIGSVVCMVLLPQYLGDTTDILISGIIKKQTYKKVENGYKELESIVKKVDEVKDLVYEINNSEDYETIYYSLVDKNCSVGILVNMANDPNSQLDQEVKERIYSIPESTYAIPLRRIMGYYFNGEWVHKPIYEQDMTFRQYLDYIEYKLEITGSIPQPFIDAFLDQKINDTNGYFMINAYEKANTIGEFLAINGIEDAFSIPKSYKEEVYGISIKEAPNIDWSAFTNMLIKLSILAVLYSVFAYIQGFILAGVAQKVSARLRQDINDKIYKLPLSYFDKTPNGEILSLLSNDVDSISTSLNQTISQIFTAVCTILGMFVMMLRISWLLTIISIACVVLALSAMSIIVKVSQKYFSKQQENIDKINGRIEESFSNSNEIKLYVQEDKIIEEFNKINEDLSSSTTKASFLSGIMQSVTKLIGNLGYVASCVFGAILVIDGTITIGSMQSFVQYLRLFTLPFNQISASFSMFQSSVAAAERVFEFLNQQEENYESGSELQSIKGKISFENVSFGYTEKEVLKKCTFNCKEGEKIAIVGQTGSGKTTIVKLLMNFYEIKNGEIKIDDISIKDISRHSLRDHVSIVLQDSWLFEGTILDNIKYGNLNATKEQVIEACKIANVHEFIEKLPGGYNFVINGSNNNISQGQKQLITIARAVLSNKEIIILDEASSAIDSLTEKNLQNAIKNLTKGKTSIVIAHRLSTIKDSDKIIVLKEGEIVQSGKHKELLAQEGYYNELYMMQ